MNIRPSVLIIQNNKLLTLRYNYNGNLVYALPGGNLEFGEKLSDGLRRELYEEIGIEISIKRLACIGEVHKNNKSTLHCIFESEIIDGVPKLNPNETTALEINWIEIDKIEACNLYPNISSFVFNKFVKKTDISDNLFLGIIDQNWF